MNNVEFNTPAKIENILNYIKKKKRTILGIDLIYKFVFYFSI